MNLVRHKSGAILALSLCGALIAQEPDDLPLPQWTPDELQALRDGSAPPPLLNNFLWPQNEAALFAEEPAPADDPNVRQPPAELSRFLPPHLLASPGAGHSVPQAFTQTPLNAVRDVPASFLIQAQAWPEGELLIDPHGVISETIAGDFLRFLEFHARDSVIRLHVLLMDRHEKLPANAKVADIAQGSLLRGRACLAVLPRGEPWRLRLFLSREVHAVAPPAELAAILEDCVKDALQATDEDEQIHRLMVRLSIRLFWLQRLLPEQRETARAAETKPVAVEARSQNLDAEPFPEILAAEPVPMDRFWLWRIAGILLVFLCFIAWRWRGYKLRHYVWTLPESKVQPRLGGAHCGGGTWIDYR